MSDVIDNHPAAETARRSPLPPDWAACFPAFARAPEPEVRRMLDGAARVELPENTWVFRAGTNCAHYLLATAGRIRVQLTGINGREVALYRVEGGHSCILTTACMLSGERYPAEAWTETPVRALAIERGAFQSALDSSAEFRRFVFTNFSARLADVLRRMDDLLFAPIDGRLADCILDAERRDALTSITHQDIAVELGTAREVVSRHLKRFEARGWIRLGRGAIEILDTAALAREVRCDEVTDAGRAGGDDASNGRTEEESKP
jgi:CRP/FNR family transcriptional regulator, anaerobic regulatory protein